MPKVPTLSSTPTSSTAVPGVDSAAASGSHVWNGTSGALIANAKKKPRNSHFWVPGSIVRPASAVKSKVPVPSCSADTTYRPMSEASMSRPPNSEYSRNFTAA